MKKEPGFVTSVLLIEVTKAYGIFHGLQLIFIVAAAGNNMHNAIIYKIYDSVFVVYASAPQAA